MVLVLLMSASADPVTWSIYARTGASVYSSSARLIGGTGGAVGVELRSAPMVGQLDVGFLAGLGTVGEARVAFGVEWPGIYRPAALASVALLFGTQTKFLTDSHPLGVRGPAVCVGTELAPMRFVRERWHLSALQVGVGVGTDWPEVGLGLRVTFFQLGVDW
jgi:hypothetical protein